MRRDDPASDRPAARRRAARLVAAAALILSALDGSAAGAERLVVLADLNGRYGSTVYHRRIDAAVDRIVELRPDAVLVAGDMVAGQRRRPLSRTELLAMWSEFHRRVTDPLREAGLTLVVAPGNHDASAYPGFETERAVYEQQWRERLRSAAAIGAGRLPFYYAAAVGQPLVVSLDATLPGPLPADRRKKRVLEVR